MAIATPPWLCSPATIYLKWPCRELRQISIIKQTKSFANGQTERARNGAGAGAGAGGSSQKPLDVEWQETWPWPRPGADNNVCGS